MNISVVIPAWNCASWISATLDSVLSQENASFEVIVVDDGSTDNTPEILQKYHDQITVIRIENSGGPSQPRNVGIKAATGELISLFDSDDLMLPGTLSAARQAFEQHSEIDLLHCDAKIIDKDNNQISNSLLNRYTSFRITYQPIDLPNVSTAKGEDLYHSLIKSNFVCTSSVVAKKSALLDAGGFDESLLNGDDRDMWLKLAHSGCTFAFRDDFSHCYRKLDNSVTARGTGRYPAVIDVMERQLLLVEDSTTLDFLENKIAELYAGYGRGLSVSADFNNSIKAYKKSLRKQFKFKTALALIRAFLKIKPKA